RKTTSLSGLSTAFLAPSSSASHVTENRSSDSASALSQSLRSTNPSLLDVVMSGEAVYPSFVKAGFSRGREYQEMIIRIRLYNSQHGLHLGRPGQGTSSNRHVV